MKGNILTQLNWYYSLNIAASHIFGILGLISIFRGEVAWQTMAFSTVLVILGGLGITIGAHRLWAHRAFKAKTPLRLLLMIWQTIADQVLWHRAHDKFSDTALDPHDSTKGFWYAHIGWLVLHKDINFVDLENKIRMNDLELDRIVMWQKRNFLWLQWSIAVFLPTIIPWLLWGESLWLGLIIGRQLRMIVSLHSTWCINSVAHRWGSKPYDKSIVPCNNVFASIVSLGEGWHNYHHTFPWDYKTSELGFNYWNPSTTIIHFFAMIGWAYDLRSPSKKIVKTRKFLNNSVELAE